jgi:hypothetical protein
MQKKKIKNLKKELNDIRESLIEEKKRFSGKIKKKARMNQKNCSISF